METNGHNSQLLIEEIHGQKNASWSLEWQFATGLSGVRRFL